MGSSSLCGNVAIVTGGGQGIGRAVAAVVSDDFSYMSGQTLMLTGGA